MTGASVNMNPEKLEEKLKIAVPARELDRPDASQCNCSFPADRGIKDISRNYASEHLFIGNDKINSGLEKLADAFAFAALFVFSRIQNQSHVRAWRSSGTEASAGEYVSAQFSSDASLRQAFASFRTEPASIPIDSDFAIVAPGEFVEATALLSFEPEEMGIRLALTADTSRVAMLSACDFLEKISLLVFALLKTPDLPCGELELITDSARTLLPDLSHPIEARSLEAVHETFFRQAQKYSTHPAIVAANGSYTYAELYRLVRHIQARLLDCGIERGEVVAISGFMSAGTVAAMIAVMAAGGVMVTVDEALPELRRNLILDIAKPRHRIRILPQAEADRANEIGIAIADWPTREWISTLPDAAILPSQLTSDASAYIFFTSGSTGNPKGVRGTHLGLAHFLDWQRTNYPIGPGDRAAQFTALSFDVVLRDVLFPLTSGACLHMPERGSLLDARRTLRWVSDQRISVMHCVPSLMKAWLKGADGQQPFRSLKFIFFAGEPLTDSLLEYFVAAASPEVKTANFYGPTETTLAKLAFNVTSIEPGVQPVGRPQPGTDVAIIRDRQFLCGLWETGEIAIRTPYRSKGYLGNEELTQQVFQVNRFTGDPADLIYYTGDLGRYRADGKIEIFGRIDSQIKIRGVRIEPNEIESQMSRLPGIRDAAVTICSSGNGEKTLAALVVPNTFLNAEQQEEFGKSVREVLKGRLIEAMVPSLVLIIDSLPYLPNGKIDRKALPALAELETGLQSQTVAEDVHDPNSPIGRLIAGWRKTFSNKPITANSTFLSLEGDSLSYVTALLELESVVGNAPDDWPSMPLRELAGLVQAEGHATATKKHGFTLVDTSALVRCIAILSVVGSHFNVIPGGFGPAGLFVVSGYFFSKLQLAEFSETKTYQPFWRFITRILAPYYAIEAVVLLATWKSNFPYRMIADIFLLHDLIPAAYAEYNRSYLWYIHGLIHIAIFYALLLYAFNLKDKRSENTCTHAIYAACAIGLLSRFVVPYLMDNTFFQQSLPSFAIERYFFLNQLVAFSIGAAIAIPKPMPRYAAFLTAFVVTPLNWTPFGNAEALGLLICALLLFFAHQLYIPSILRLPVYYIANASLFIYMTHMPVQAVFKRLNAPAEITFIVSIASGIAAWRLWTFVQQRRHLASSATFGLGSGAASRRPELADIDKRQTWRWPRRGTGSLEQPSGQRSTLPPD
jgi:amino acid adenylation domain-containing protein